MKFFGESFFEFSFLDIYKCPFFEFSKTMLKKIEFVTIKKFYRLVTEKIILILLR